MNNTEQPHPEYLVLERIDLRVNREHQPVRQRDIAEAVGLSLGMTNVIVKRLARKGWLSIRKVNNRNIQYIVTPKGIAQIARRSVAYLRRTIGSIASCHEALARFIDEVKRQGYTAVGLVGTSDLDFLLEYLCQRKHVAFSRGGREKAGAGCWYVYGEDLPAPSRASSRPGRSSVADILGGRGAR